MTPTPHYQRPIAPSERKASMKKMLSAAALVTASALALTGCAPAPAASQSPSQSASATPQNITLWVAGGDTR